MADVSMSQSTSENVSEYEAIIEQLLAEMRSLNEMMERDRIEIDRIKAETKILKAETARLEAENRAVLQRLKAAA